jgi:ribonucleotide reductase beta subunit family protein with ferritin-like domain
MYRKARESYWLPDEINLTEDIRQWSTSLTGAERHSLSRILSFFATADGLVAENLVERFASEVTVPEIRLFYGFQIAM